MSEAKKVRAPDLWEWTLGDRMKKSLRVAGISRDDMADYLGVAPATVSTWMNDRIHPSTQTQRLWALKTGAPYDWLTGKYTPRDLNPEPTDSGLGNVTLIDLAPSLRERGMTRAEILEAIDPADWSTVEPPKDSRRAAKRPERGGAA